ncbi:MAG TPA: hypothetical protein VGI04_09600, partial [Neobacillus sp.]
MKKDTPIAIFEQWMVDSHFSADFLEENANPFGLILCRIFNAAFLSNMGIYFQVISPSDTI